MNISASQVKDIKAAFAKLQPEKVTLNGTRSLTVKEAVFALAPTLERMKKRGFDMTELVEKLHEKGVPVKAQTLAKYLNEFRRGKDKKTDTPRPPVQAAKFMPTTQLDRPATATGGGFAITPDMPLDEL